MKFIGMILKLIGWVVETAVILAICSSLLFIAYKGNQPMQVPEAPKGITYFEFVADRIDAAKTVEPSRCGWCTAIWRTRLVYGGPPNAITLSAE